MAGAARRERKRGIQVILGRERSTRGRIFRQRG
jgi:hypothetical protein